MKKKFRDGSPQVSVKQCQILKRTMRTVLQDLAQKSLKGLGTKARTNWEDRSANSLAYQVSNHDTFLYAGCISLPSSHRMRDIFRYFKGYSSALELGARRAQRWYFVSEHAWRDVPPLENTSLLVNNPGLYPPPSEDDIFTLLMLHLGKENVQGLKHSLNPYRAFVWQTPANTGLFF